MKVTIKQPVYHRQRLILFFLDSLPARRFNERGGLLQMELQKLLLLYCKDVKSRHYEFVPWYNGCYSFQCAVDLNLLVKQGWIKIRNNNLFLNQSINGENWAEESDERERVRHWVLRHPWRGNELGAKTYQRHPYYALHNAMKERLLSSVELARVERSVAKPRNGEIVVFTLGYEGVQFEAYLNTLISNRVAVLCDVRRNPWSHKFGFSAERLSQVLPKLNIKYKHLPEFGVVREKRQFLRSRADYQVLFDDYSKNLTNNKVGLRRIRQVIESKYRVALTCFESRHQNCHRHCISNLLEDEFHYRVVHL